jgi:hypothetical protein
MITSDYGRSASDTPTLGRQQLSGSPLRSTRPRSIGAVQVSANDHTTSPHRRVRSGTNPDQVR